MVGRQGKQIRLGRFGYEPIRCRLEMGCKTNNDLTRSFIDWFNPT